MKDQTLKGQKILVTGVSRPNGIGAAIARLCAQAGAAVAIHGFTDYDMQMKYSDASNSYIDYLAKELSEDNLNIIPLNTSDLSNADQPGKIISEAVIKLGSLNGLVLNHAYSVNAPLGKWTAEHIDLHLSINVRASMLLIQEFEKQIQDNNGAVTLFTSGQYLGPMIDEIAYAVSKDAVIGLCKQASVLLASKNIRVNCINPGPTDTGYLEGEEYKKVAQMFPSGKWGTPEDAARLVCFLHSDDARWITSQIIASEGGFNRFIS